MVGGDVNDHLKLAAGLDVADVAIKRFSLAAQFFHCRNGFLKQATVLIVQFFNLAQTVGPVFRVGRIGKIWQAYPTDGISLAVWRIEGLRGIDVKTIIQVDGNL